MKFFSKVLKVITNYTPTKCTIFFNFLFFNHYICISHYKAYLTICDTNIIADNNGCKLNVDYKPPEDGIVRAETYVGVEK